MEIKKLKSKRQWRKAKKRYSGNTGDIIIGTTELVMKSLDENRFLEGADFMAKVFTAETKSLIQDNMENIVLCLVGIHHILGKEFNQRFARRFA